MIIERDEGSDGWIAYEGKWNPETFEFERLRACFKCWTVEHWITAPIKDGLLTELEVEQTPIGALRQCVVFPSGNVNDTCYFCWVWLQMFPP